MDEELEKRMLEEGVAELMATARHYKKGLEAALEAVLAGDLAKAHLALADGLDDTMAVEAARARMSVVGASCWE